MKNNLMSYLDSFGYEYLLNQKKIIVTSSIVWTSFQIASQRLADQIPLVIRYQMLQESALQLQREMIQLLQEKENGDDLLKEEYDIGAKRNNLVSRLNRLMQAQNRVLTF